MASEQSNNRSYLIQLFILCFAALFLELFAIRWLGCELQAFRVFKAFPLATCFIGMGVGCAANNDKWFKYTPLAILVFVLLSRIPVFFHIDWVSLPTISMFVEWANVLQFKDCLPRYLVFFAAYLIMILSGLYAPMYCLGSRIGVLMNQGKPLTAYGVNLVGSLAGSIAFSLLAFMGLPPWALLLPLMLVVAAYCLRFEAKHALLLLALPLALGVTWWDRYSSSPDLVTMWSPYQRLDIRKAVFNDVVDGKKKTYNAGIEVFSNHISYQFAINWLDALKPGADVAPAVKEYMNQIRRCHTLPFLVKPAAREILIVGAGTGIDVAEGLRHGPDSIDAVDIDPCILEAGKRWSPLRPYDNARAHPICADAREYFNRCKKKYDLIFFAFLDSHVVLGQGISSRLDNYVYTKESFARAASLLKPDGVMVIAFFTQQNWFTDRLYMTLQEAVGYPPVIFADKRHDWFQPHTLLAAGDPVRKGEIKLPEGEGDVFTLIKNYSPDKNLRILTDDWPFIYVIPVAVDAPYLLVVSTLLLLGIYAGRRFLFARPDPLYWQMFFMGAAFLLLELQAIARLNLIYGANWLTSGIVINCILALAIFSNLVADRAGERCRPLLPYLFGGLFVCLGISYLLPVDTILSGCAAVTGLGPALVTLATVLPLFIAGIIFSTSFASAEQPSRALSFNLAGAVLGAMLEYLCNYVGLSGLVICGGILYGFALVSALFWCRKAGA